MKNLSAVKQLIIAFLFCAGILPAGAQTTYTWNLAGGGNWATANNWTPIRTSPSANDILVINGGGSKSITNVITQTIGRLQISGNTSVVLSPSGAARTLTLSNTGQALSIQSGSSLSLIGESGGGIRYMTIKFSGTGNTALIAGTLNLNITSNDPGIYNATNSSTSVNGRIINNGGTLTSSSANLSFAAAAEYQHTINGGTIAMATWSAGSFCRLTGITNSVPSGLNQPFSNFTWDCASQSANLTLNGQLTTVNGNLVINTTNDALLTLASMASSTYTLQVAGKLQVNTGSWLAIVAGDNINATVNISGDFELTGATSSSSYFDFYYYTSGGATLNKVVMNVSGNYIQSGGLMDLAYGNSDAAAYNELRLSGNFQLSGDAILYTGTSDNSVSNGLLVFTKAGTQTYTVANPLNIGYVNYRVNSGSTLQLLSEVMLSSDATAVWAGQFNVNNGGILDAGTQRISSSTGSGAGVNNAFVVNAGGRLISANTSGVQNDAVSGTVSTAITTRTFNSAGDYEFTGAVTGIFTTSPSANTVRNLIVNNSSGSVTLSQPLTVTGSLQLNNGILVSSMTNLLTIADNATSSAGNFTPARFVEGPVRKIGNDAFTFPVGKSGVYAPASISAPGAVNAEYRAEYFRSVPPNRNNITAPGLVKVSLCEYWDIEEVGPGSPVVDVTLSWSGFSPCNAAAYVTDLATLTVAHFDGTNWNSHSNNGGFSGNASQGNVKRNTVSSFSIFTLGSTTAAANPLSVKFTAVKAYTSGTQNKVEWTNLSEAGVQLYTVEKSEDGLQFSGISEVQARSNAGSRESYIITDNSPASRIYYRVKATELSGEISYSPVVKVIRSGNTGFSIYPNPVTGKQFTIQFSSLTRETLQLQLFSSSGQQVYHTNWNHPGGNAAQTVELPAELTGGVYLLQLSGTASKKSSTILIQ